MDKPGTNLAQTANGFCYFTTNEWAEWVAQTGMLDFQDELQPSSAEEMKECLQRADEWWSKQGVPFFEPQVLEDLTDEILMSLEETFNQFWQIYRKEGSYDYRRALITFNNVNVHFLHPGNKGKGPKILEKIQAISTDKNYKIPRSYLFLTVARAFQNYVAQAELYADKEELKFKAESGLKEASSILQATEGLIDLFERDGSEYPTPENLLDTKISVANWFEGREDFESILAVFQDLQAHLSYHRDLLQGTISNADKRDFPKNPRSRPFRVYKAFRAIRNKIIELNDGFGWGNPRDLEELFELWGMQVNSRTVDRNLERKGKVRQ